MKHWLTDGKLTTTRYGLMDEDDPTLRKVEGDDGQVHWVEFYVGDELVHRSVLVRGTL